TNGSILHQKQKMPTKFLDLALKQTMVSLRNGRSQCERGYRFHDFPRWEPGKDLLSRLRQAQRHREVRLLADIFWLALSTRNTPRTIRQCPPHRWRFPAMREYRTRQILR